MRNYNMSTNMFIFAIVSLFFSSFQIDIRWHGDVRPTYHSDVLFVHIPWEHRSGRRDPFLRSCTARQAPPRNTVHCPLFLRIDTWCVCNVYGVKYYLPFMTSRSSVLRSQSERASSYQQTAQGPMLVDHRFDGLCGRLAIDGRPRSHFARIP